MKYIVNIIIVSVLLSVGIVMADEKPRAIVLQNIDGEHLGFTLFHPTFLEDSGDCVFVIIPKTVEIYESEIADYLLTMKEKGGFQWARKDGVVTVSRGGSSYLAYLEGGKLKNMKSGKVIGSWQTTKK